MTKPVYDLMVCHDGATRAVPVINGIKIDPSLPNKDKKKKEEKNGKYCDNGCDIDNYLKAILDSLNGVLFVHDRQVVRVRLLDRDRDHFAQVDREALPRQAILRLMNRGAILPH